MKRLAFPGVMFAACVWLVVGHLWRGDVWQPIAYGACGLGYWAECWWRLGKEAS